MRPRLKRVIFIAPFAILGMALFVFLGGELVKYLWNWLVPSLFGLPQVTFWQALGLLALCRILFGGMGGRGGHSRSKHRGRIAERFQTRKNRWGRLEGSQWARPRNTESTLEAVSC